MNVKFAIKAVCRADNIDFKPSENEIAKAIESVLYEHQLLKTIVEVYGLTYEEEGEQDETS